MPLPKHLQESNDSARDVKKQQYRGAFLFPLRADPGGSFVVRRGHAVEEGSDHEIENPHE
jgi:hypothetical protein